MSDGSGLLFVGPVSARQIAWIVPNTLVHIGVQGGITRLVFPKAELHLVYAGCLIPDLPWILQRGVRALFPGVDAYDLRLYSVTQASLVMCLVLSAALAAVLASPLRAMAVLASGCLLHLLLDPCEIKWANGVSLFAPFDWNLAGFGLVWPEHPVVTLLTVFGLGYFFWNLRRATAERLSWSRRPAAWVVGVTMLVAYYVLPLTGMHEARAADNHFVQTLLSPSRVGKSVEFDRARYEGGTNGGVLQTFAGERLNIIGITAEGHRTVSVRGHFIEQNTIAASAFHFHPPLLRDVAGYAGILLIAGLWGYLGFRSLRERGSLTGREKKPGAE